MKLRSGKVIGLSTITVPLKGNVMKEEIKNLIEDDLKQLKEVISNQSTYDYIIKQILDIYTKHLPPIEVLNSLEKDTNYLADDNDNELWGCVYSLSTLIKASHPVLASIYYEEDFMNNEELKIEVADEIYNFILIMIRV